MLRVRGLGFKVQGLGCRGYSCRFGGRIQLLFSWVVTYIRLYNVGLTGHNELKAIPKTHPGQS